MSQEESLYDLLHTIALEYAFGRADMENDLIFNEESRKEKT